MPVQNRNSQATIALAKTGDPQALEQLMSGPLQSRGIQVAVERKGPMLLVSLASQPCPSKKASLAFMRQGLEKLGISGINSVRVSGYQSGELNPAWVERLPLTQGEQSSSALQKIQETPSASPSALKKSLLMLTALLLALAAIGLIVRAITRQPQERPAAIEQTTPPTGSN